MPNESEERWSLACGHSVLVDLSGTWADQYRATTEPRWCDECQRKVPFPANPTWWAGPRRKRKTETKGNQP